MPKERPTKGNPKLLAPEMLQVCQQRPGYGDCVISAIGTLLSVPYEVVLSMSAHVNLTALDGQHWDSIKATIAGLGYESRLVKKGRWDPHESVGILHVYQGTRVRTGKNHHAVVLWKGRIVDGGHQLWLHIEDFLAAKGYNTGSLLEVYARTG